MWSLRCCFIASPPQALARLSVFHREQPSTLLDKMMMKEMLSRGRLLCEAAHVAKLFSNDLLYGVLSEILCFQKLFVSPGFINCTRLSFPIASRTSASVDKVGKEA
jgi:hypothetical protein